MAITKLNASVDLLNDVDTTTAAPADKEVLAWDSSTSQWEPLENDFVEEAPTSGLIYGRANGTWIEVTGGEGGGGTGGAGSVNLAYDKLTPNSTADTFNLTIAGEAREPLGATNLLVSVNGVIQEPGVAFTTTGSTITFTEVPQADDVIDFIVELTNGSHWELNGVNLEYAGEGTKVVVDQFQANGDAVFMGTATADKLASNIVGSGLSQTFPMNNKAQPHYGVNWQTIDDSGVSSVPVGMSGYFGIDFATQGEKRFSLASDGVATFSGDLISDANVFGANLSTVGAVAAARVIAGAPNIALPTHKGQVRVGTYSVDGNVESGVEWQVRGDGAGYGFRAVNTNSGPSGNEWILQTRGNSASWTDALVVGGDGNVGIGMTPATFGLSAKEQLAEWKTKAKKASWPIVTDGAFEQEPAEDLVTEWMETRAAGDKLQVDGRVSAEKLVIENPDGAGNFKAGISVTALDTEYDDKAGLLRIQAIGENNPALVVGVGEGGHSNFIHYANGAHEFNRPAGSTLNLDINGNASFSNAVYIGDKNDETDRKQILYLGASRPWSFVQNGTGASQRLQLYAEVAGNKVFSIGGLDNPAEDVIEFFAQSGAIKAKGDITGNTLRGTRLVQDGAPVVDAKGLINTLSTLRKATMDETQDIRESLRSAIDELVAGFEQEIATMPAPEPEVSTMPAGDES